jgi:putative Mn2+ efflux pump MntP
MSIWAVLAIAVALAMDTFAVALASGVALKRVSGRQTFRLAWHFGLFQALMPIAGWSVGLTVHSVIEKVDHWLAFALLVFVSVRMIIEAVKKNKGEVDKPDPTKGGTMVMLSVATSIDALAVGLSLSFLRVSIWWPALVIGLIAGSFTIIGLHLGRFLSTGSRLGHFAELIGGAVLLGIGVKILYAGISAVE